MVEQPLPQGIRLQVPHEGPLLPGVLNVLSETGNPATKVLVALLQHPEGLTRHDLAAIVGDDPQLIFFVLGLIEDLNQHFDPGFSIDTHAYVGQRTPLSLNIANPQPEMHIVSADVPAEELPIAEPNLALSHVPSSVPYIDVLPPSPTHELTEDQVLRQEEVALLVRISQDPSFKSLKRQAYYDLSFTEPSYKEYDLAQEAVGIVDEPVYHQRFIELVTKIAAYDPDTKVSVLRHAMQEFPGAQAILEMFDRLSGSTFDIRDGNDGSLFEALAHNFEERKRKQQFMTEEVPKINEKNKKRNKKK